MSRWYLSLTAALLFFALTVLVALSARGQAQDIIAEIRVVGTQRIEPSTVMSRMALTAGEPFDAALMDRSLKALFETGLFADVTLRREGQALIVQVVENPIINRIAFEGNRRIDDEVLLAEVSLRQRVVYTRTKVQTDVQRLLDLYRISGRFAATVEPKVIQLPQNRVDLVFEITEGPLTAIRKISFIGNATFSDRTLRGVIQTVESAWYRFLTTEDRYDPDRLTFDRELLRRFYLAQGYADFRVASAVAELTPDQEAFIITFTVEEGRRYRFGKIDVTSQLRELPPERLRGLVTTVEGDRYNRERIEDSVAALTDAIASLGFAFGEVRRRTDRDRDALTIDITYEIREGPRVYIERIDIEGNVRTHDKVIRREYLQVEGDALSSAAQRRSLQRIRNLGFFDRVDVQMQPGEEPDKRVIVVEVQEKSTGELSFGAGFSTTVGFLGDIELRERNLLGKGQDLRLGLGFAQLEQRIDLNFTEPYFLDKELSAGFDLFHRINDRQDESSFDEKETGFGLRAGYQLTEPLRHNLRYRLARREVTNVPDTASRFIRQQEGSTLISSISNEFYYDRLDSRFDPTEGYFLKYGVDVAGLGGSTRYLRNTIGAGYFLPFFSRDMVLGVSGEAGYIFGIGENVRLTDRFYLGDRSLRGFDFRGVGPRDLGTDDALGGNRMARGTVELRFPLGFPKEFGVTGLAFSDFGMLTDIEESGDDIADEGSLRVSVGIGISWRSPVGPVRVEYAVPVVKEDFDREQRFRLRFGTRF